MGSGVECPPPHPSPPYAADYIIYYPFVIAKDLLYSYFCYQLPVYIAIKTNLTKNIPEISLQRGGRINFHEERASAINHRRHKVLSRQTGKQKHLCLPRYIGSLPSLVIMFYRFWSQFTVDK